MAKKKKQSASNAEEKKYITLEEGEDFRTIAKIMSDNGFKMNHATARNQVMSSLYKLMNKTGTSIKLSRVKQSDIDKLFKDQSLNNEFSDMLQMTYDLYLEELNYKKGIKP